MRKKKGEKGEIYSSTDFHHTDFHIFLLEHILTVYLLKISYSAGCLVDLVC